MVRLVTPTVPEMGEPNPALTLNTRVTVALAPLASAEPWQATLGDDDGFEHDQPSGAFDDWKVVPAGVPIVRDGVAAGSGPALVMVAVKVSSSPWPTGAGAALSATAKFAETTRSTLSVTSLPSPPW